MEELGTYLVVEDGSGRSLLIAVDEEPRIDALVGEYLSSGRTRDRVVELEQIDGSSVKLPVSAIRNWFTSTPAIRRRCMELDIAMEREAIELEKEVRGWTEG
jgi:hypothetical protein